MSQSIPVSFVSQYKGDKKMAKSHVVTEREGIAAQLKKKKEKEKYQKLISGGAAPEEGSTVLVGNKTGAQAISAEEYAKRQNQPKKKGFLRGLARIMGRNG
jgi:hypothetical protein